LFILLDCEVNINEQDSAGYTALQYSCFNGHLKIIKLLFNFNNIDVNIKNFNDLTALMLASMRGHTKIVEFLLNQGADVNLIEKDNCSALHFASFAGHVDIVELFLAHGAEVNQKNEFDQSLLIFILEHNAIHKSSKEINNIFIKKRVKKIIKIREIIASAFCSYDVPNVTQIISEFATGLDNLKTYIKKRKFEDVNYESEF